MQDITGHIVIIGGAAWNQVIHLDTQIPAHASTLFARHSYETPGGTGLGKSVCLSLLGEAVVFQTTLGHDVYGQNVLDYLSGFKIDLIVNQTDIGTERHTNLALPSDQRISLVTSPPPGCDVKQMQETITALDGASIIMPSILPYVRPLLPTLIETGSPIWIDLHNYDGEASYHHPFIEAADVLFVSGERLLNADTFMRQQIDLGKSLVVVTNGKQGAVCLTVKNEWYHQEALPVTEIIDTNGAGDAFIAGFAHYHLKGAPIDACLHAGAVAGALAVQTHFPMHDKLSAQLIEEATHVGLHV